MADKSNVNTNVPMETPSANPIVGLDTSTVNSMLVGEEPNLGPSVATSTPAINSFVRNMVDLVMSQYVSHGTVLITANPYLNSVMLPMNHMEKPDKFSGPNLKWWQ